MSNLAAATLLLFVHSWYPMECCGGKDCRPADTVERKADGSFEVRVGKDTFSIPESFERRPSQDGNYHICYGRLFDAAPFVSCFFIPGET